MKPNRFRQAIADGKVPVGHMIMEFGTRGIAKILEASGVDFVVFDMEHSGIDVDRMADLLAWSKAASFSPFVRVPQPHYHFLARIMDAGAQGIMVPNVETAEQARAIVDAVKYPPAGHRGVGLGTAHNDYVMPKPEEYFAEANANNVVICQIESPAGVDNSAAIAEVEGVDVLWVGQFDLSVAMGIPGHFEDEAFKQALATVTAAAARAGKRAGIQPGTPEQAVAWMKAGFNVISWQSDIALYRGALSAAVKRVRDLAARPASTSA